MKMKMKISFFLLGFFFNSLASAAAATTTTTTPLPLQPQETPAIMPLMLVDTERKLRDDGFSRLSRWMEANQAELALLQTITVFALDDVAISSGSPGYVNSLRYHILPNLFLTMADLERLPVGKKLPTLERGQSLVVTTSGSGAFKINGVTMKVPNLIRNDPNIVVHNVYSAFPRVHPTAAVNHEGRVG